MTKTTTNALRLVAAGILLIAVGPPSYGSLIGDQVEVRLFPFGPSVTDTVLSGLPEPNFDDLGPQLGAAGNTPRWDVDFEASSIRVDFIQPTGIASYGNGASIYFQDLDWVGTPTPGIITGVNVTSELTPGGFSLTQPGMVTFGPDWVRAQIAPNSGVIDWNQGTFFNLELITTHVPEPGTGLLALFGAVGAFALRRIRT